MIVTMFELKNHMGISGGDTTNDTTLYNCLKASNQAVTREIGYGVEYGEFEETYFLPGKVYLRNAPLVEIDTITDSDSEVIDDHTANNLLGIVDIVATGAVVIKYAAGYGESTTAITTAGPMPEDIKLSVIITAETLFDRRGGFGNANEKTGSWAGTFHEGLPPTVKDLISTYRRPRL